MGEEKALILGVPHLAHLFYCSAILLSKQESLYCFPLREYSLFTLGSGRWGEREEELYRCRKYDTRIIEKVHGWMKQ